MRVSPQVHQGPASGPTKAWSNSADKDAILLKKDGGAGEKKGNLLDVVLQDIEGKVRDWVEITHIHQRSQTSYTTPCNYIISHGAQFGCFQVFAMHSSVYSM